MVCHVKIVAIIALIVTAIFMVLTGFKTPNGVASLSNISQNFLTFPQWLYEFCHGFVVFFAYQAIEFIGITTSEMSYPQYCLKQ